MTKEVDIKICPFINGIASCDHPGRPNCAAICPSGQKFCCVIGDYKKCDGFPRIEPDEALPKSKTDSS